MSSLSLAFLTPLLLVIGTAFVGCPPVIMNEKLHGILPVTNQRVSYSETVDCGSTSQQDLFRRARLWLAQSGHLLNEPGSLSDKETGDLAGRCVQPITLARSESSPGGIYTFRYSYVIECVNRKYRATLSQVEVDEGGGRFSPVETYCQKNEKDLQSIYLELDKHFKGTLASLQESVKNYKSF
ncbi:DUF4468 domain-containing protein [Spirosoma sp. KNUC1025]|uniref:DUF4468 domain-containing protein n=1 Tax=Spirosoma sp. KNUC1025 TaxID=2894082 RepID=UPI0038666B5B|nr:DUF4468 domain-containing protein [Spirosoma sp. KNUC1025]